MSLQLVVLIKQLKHGNVDRYDMILRSRMDMISLRIYFYKKLILFNILYSLAYFFVLKIYAYVRIYKSTKNIYLCLIFFLIS